MSWLMTPSANPEKQLLLSEAGGPMMKLADLAPASETAFNMEGIS